MTITTDTKTFTLAQMLSITTSRLCCDIGGVYDILNHVTGDNLYTHVLPRACRFAAPLLLKDHPELAPANACLANLDKWVARDRTERKTECIKMWLAELKLMFPAMAKPFEVVFESTESLARALPGLIGKSKWDVLEAPARDEKGHFLPRKKPEAAYPPHTVEDVK